MKTLFALAICLVIFTCKTKEKSDDSALILLLASSSTQPRTATIPARFNYDTLDGLSLDPSITSPYRVRIGTAVRFTANFSTPIIANGFVTISSVAVSPSLVAGLTLDSLTGDISGTVTTAPSAKFNTPSVTATFAPISGYTISGSNTFKRDLRLYIDTAAGISNVTCSNVGTAGGCTISLPYTCTASVSCSSSTTCSNLSECIFPN